MSTTTKRLYRHFNQLYQKTFCAKPFLIKKNYEKTQTLSALCVCESAQAFKWSFKTIVERIVYIKEKSLSLWGQNDLCLFRVSTLGLAMYRDPFQTDILIQEGYACNLLFNNSLCLLYSCRSMDVLINSPPLSLSPLSNLSFHQSGTIFPFTLCSLYICPSVSPNEAKLITL